MFIYHVCHTLTYEDRNVIPPLPLVALMLFSILGSFGGLIAEDKISITELSEENTALKSVENFVLQEGTWVHIGVVLVRLSSIQPMTTCTAPTGGGGTQSEDFTYISFWETSHQQAGPASDCTNQPHEHHIQTLQDTAYGHSSCTVFGDAPSGQYYTVGGQSYDKPLH